MHRLATATLGDSVEAARIVAGVCRDMARDEGQLPLWYQVMAETRARAIRALDADAPATLPVFHADDDTIPVTHVITQDAFRTLDTTDQQILWDVLTGQRQAETDEERFAEALRHLGAAVANQSIPDWGDLE